MPRFDGFVPGRHPLDAFGAGGFRFAGMGHVGSILATPAGIAIWPVTCFADVTAQSFQRVLDEADTIDFLLIGTGADIAFIPHAWRALLKERGITVEGMATGAAARTYNVLVGEDRRVAAALIAVD
ncbi:Mth938-like domain-containing protein [Bosea sp. (in: a-proteobacteria)]|uniref:Mth938-like domain-containing protein n=1 Tax=Bosea sp. (in: a-proteobacteria) TaxID=1871050 RepID=UPI002735FC8B|nr:MTH938/NDUFAF3 family protein [Bosea sp. (in: a-proteobacteria)]MDP3408001.1 MTH938/NDUFAF3 family protein [Bosea sp. (in: a-proteobacteria)]